MDVASLSNRLEEIRLDVEVQDDLDELLASSQGADYQRDTGVDDATTDAASHTSHQLTKTDETGLSLEKDRSDEEEVETTR